MKLSFWTLGTPDWSNRQVAEGAQRFGYQGVDLRCAPGRNVSLESTPQEVSDLTKLFADHGVAIASLLIYNQRGTGEGVDWPAVTDDIVRHAELASRMGVSMVRVNAGAPAKDSTWDAYLDGFAAAMSKAGAESDGVVFNMQNHTGSMTATQVAKVAAMVDLPRFGVGLSPDHCVDMDEDTLAATRAAAPWLKQLHLADRERLADGKLKAIQPGEGFVPNVEVIGIAKDVGFEGWVSFKWEKPTYPDLPDAEVALPKFVTYMKGLGVG